MSACILPECSGPTYARGMCMRHYHRWRRTSNTEPGALVDVPRTARVIGGTAWWTPMPLTVLPTHPRHVGRALFDLAERAGREGWDGPRFEAEQRRVLEGARR